MKPAFSNLKSHHFSSDRMNGNYLSGEDIYKQAGYNIDELMRQNPGYENTCAVRMSLALINSGVEFSGRLRIKEGPHKEK